MSTPIIDRQVRIVPGERELQCSHEWRIIENFHEELPRDLSKPRVYAAYCIYCLLSKGVEVKIK